MKITDSANRFNALLERYPRQYDDKGRALARPQVFFEQALQCEFPVYAGKTISQMTREELEVCLRHFIKAHIDTTMEAAKLVRAANKRGKDT